MRTMTREIWGIVLTFHNTIILKSDKLLAPCPISKLYDCPLSPIYLNVWLLLFKGNL